MPFSALVIGEALTDIVVSASERIEYPGGSPMNVAIGLARLGADVTLHTAIGADARGRAIAQHVAASGVRLTGESVGDSATSTATATIGASGAATYEFRMTAVGHPLAAVPAVDVVHSGSIGALDPHVLDTFRSATTTVSYDPNVRPALMTSADRGRIEQLVALADVVKASDEDLLWLYPDVEPRESARRWAAGTPSVVVLTRGGDGAEAFAGTTHVAVPAPVIRVADTIGAGDSFMAGLLTALGDRRLLGAKAFTIDEGALRDVVAFAARCAAVTVTRPGADPPTRADLAD